MLTKAKILEVLQAMKTLILFAIATLFAVSAFSLPKCHPTQFRRSPRPADRAVKKICAHSNRPGAGCLFAPRRETSTEARPVKTRVGSAAPSDSASVAGMADANRMERSHHQRQHAGVDEGGIVKVARRSSGRAPPRPIVHRAIGGDALKPISAVDAFDQTLIRATPGTTSAVSADTIAVIVTA